jgi:predicted lipoprotein with Yx(FWY)xxD motif
MDMIDRTSTDRSRIRRGAVVGALAAVGLLAAACSGGSSATTTTKAPSGTTASNTASAATVRTAAVAGVGTVLVDGSGRTLYLFEPDNHANPTCSGSCASAWPPLMATGTPTAGGSARSSLLGTVRNPDGQLQVTYDHWPLYTFAGDAGPGQAHGQGINSFGGPWWVVDASGTAVTGAGSGATTAGTVPPTTRASGNGYGY